MKTHASQDMLLKAALGVLPPATENKVRRHLDACARCRGNLVGIEASIRMLADVKPGVPAVSPGENRVLFEGDRPAVPGGRGHGHARRVKQGAGWLWLAAVLALGFGLGFLVSESLRPVHVTVTRQLIVPRTPESAAGTFVVSGEGDLSVPL